MVNTQYYEDIVSSGYTGIYLGCIYKGAIKIKKDMG
jgi:hypothetical protein